MPTHSEGDENALEEETYLPIIGAGPAVDLAAAQPDFSRSVSSSLPSELSV